MRRLSFAFMLSLTLIVVFSLAGGHVDAQAGQKGAAPKKWTPPRTADGHPDLQGTFDFATATPLERPASLAGKAVLTDIEAEAYEKQQVENRKRIDDAPLPPGQVGGYNEFWYEFGTKVVGDRRTALITDPADGRCPRFFLRHRSAPTSAVLACDDSLMVPRIETLRNAVYWGTTPDRP